MAKRITLAAAGALAVAFLAAGQAGAQVRLPFFAPPSPPAAPRPVPAAPIAPMATAPAPLAPFQPLRREQVASVMRTLMGSESHGFHRNEFGERSIDALLRSPDANERERGFGMLRPALIAYARAQHGLRIDPADFSKNWSLRPVAYDAESDLNLAIAQNRLDAWLDGLPPPFDRYRQLHQALAQYHSLAARGGWASIADGPALKMGSQGERVTALRRRLAAEDLTFTDVETTAYDTALADAVGRFQVRNGFDATGVATSVTLEALNVPIEGRILQMEANMERWRWVPRIFPTDRIEVNIAAAEADLYQGNTLVEAMRAAPGRPNDQSPMLASVISSLIFNPPWNLPTGIADKEYWPKERANPGYLEAHGFRVITNPDGSTRLQQRSGKTSALGQVKFDFPNAFAVYLHDTPSRKAFSSDDRAVSHGCIRLERPFDLARRLLAGSETWTDERIDQSLADGKTIRATLPRPTAVFLLYFTVFPDKAGVPNFRNDVYDWDAALLRRLDAVHR